jgi:hypothetical protein
MTFHIQIIMCVRCSVSQSQISVLFYSLWISSTNTDISLYLKLAKCPLIFICLYVPILNLLSVAKYLFAYMYSLPISFPPPQLLHNSSNISALPPLAALRPLWRLYLSLSTPLTSLSPCVASLPPPLASLFPTLSSLPIGGHLVRYP